MDFSKTTPEIVIYGDYGMKQIQNMMNAVSNSYHCSIQLENTSMQEMDYMIMNHLSSLNLVNQLEVSNLIERMKQVKHAVIYNGDEFPRIKTNIRIKREVACTRISYGFNDRCDIQAKNLLNSSSSISFDLYSHNTLFGHFTFTYTGKKKIYDYLAVISLLIFEGYEASEIQKAFQDYQDFERIKQLEALNYSMMDLSCKQELISKLEDLRELYPYLPIYLVNVDAAFPIDLQEIGYQALRNYISRYYDYTGFMSHLEELKQEKCFILILSSNIVQM